MLQVRLGEVARVDSVQRMSDDPDAKAAIEADQRPLGTIRLGLIATPGVAHDLARDLASKLPEALRGDAWSAVAWEVPLVADAFAADARLSGVDMIDRARERMQREGWHLAICLTDLPLRNGRRPVIADASAMHGVALLSLPALGAARLRPRALETILRLLDGLMADASSPPASAATGGGAAASTAGSPTSRRRRARRTARTSASSRASCGQHAVLLGMVAANRPWRLAAGLSRSLAAALGAAAFALVTSDIWQLADSLGAVRLAGLTLLSVGATVVTLIVAHELWERGGDGLRREQAVLFNAATTITVVLGVLVLYAALFAVALAGRWLVLANGPLAKTLGHPPNPSDYLRLAWLVSLAVDGRRGARRRPRSNDYVRQAAYGYRPIPTRTRRCARPGRRGGMSARQRPCGGPRERSRRDDARRHQGPQRQAVGQPQVRNIAHSLGRSRAHRRSGPRAADRAL